MTALHLTIRSTEDGYYRWELCDGPDGAFDAAGCAPLLERVFEEVLHARRAIGAHFTADALPAQQDIPTGVHGGLPNLNHLPSPEIGRQLPHVQL